MNPVVKIKDGVATFVYDDAMAPLGHYIGVMEVTRASHVEPHPDPARVGWIADMHPVDGPVLGANGAHLDAPPFDHGWSGWHRVEPFTTRAAALDAERVWLRDQIGV